MHKIIFSEDPTTLIYLLKAYSPVNKVGKRLGQKEKTGATGLGRITKADRKMESNDSPEIPDRGADMRKAWPPFGPKERKSLREDFASIKYR